MLYLSDKDGNRCYLILSYLEQASWIQSTVIFVSENLLAENRKLKQQKYRNQIKGCDKHVKSK